MCNDESYRLGGTGSRRFKIITTYEDHVYCKPNPEYFRQILEQFKLDPSECLMVGNDVVEDLAIRTLGVPVFLVTDTMENKKTFQLIRNIRARWKSCWNL